MVCTIFLLMGAFLKVSDWPWREKLAFPSFPSSIGWLNIYLFFLSFFYVFGLSSLYQSQSMTGHKRCLHLVVAPTSFTPCIVSYTHSSLVHHLLLGLIHLFYFISDPLGRIVPNAQPHLNLISDPCVLSGSNFLHCPLSPQNLRKEKRKSTRTASYLIGFSLC